MSDTVKKRKNWTGIRYPLWFIIPGLVLYTVFFMVPTLNGFYYSMTDWSSNSGNDISFVGFKQFTEVWRNPDLGTAFKNTIVYSITVTIVKNVLGLLLALALNEKIRSRNALRAAYFSPMILNVVAMGLIFRGLLDPYNGFVNNTLRTLGLDFLALGWIGDVNLSIHMVSLMEIWRATGVAMAIFLAGLQTIPKDCNEAALIDGATYWQTFKSVTLPLLGPAITINVLLSLIYAFRMFEVIYFLTQGGPGSSSQVFMTMAYKYMGMGLYGYSAAINVILVLLNCAVAIPILIYLRKREVEL